MTDNQIGTIAWARQSGGRLTAAERDRIQRAVVEQQARSMAAASDGMRDTIRKLDLDAIPRPDSAIARKAEDYAMALSPHYLLNHCHRTYLWGALLAQADGGPIEDAELLYVASLLHDLGVVDAHFGKNQRAHCFAVEGALAAETLLNQHGMEPERTETVADAISLHINVLGVGAEHGQTAQYLAAGARCDVFGERAREIPKSDAREVLIRYPGLGVRSDFSAFLEQEAALRPEARMAHNRALMTANGPIPPVFWWQEFEEEMAG
ncbi:MAG: HD domain-containing protein [Minwuiales bacterium]|nr:HD domain-containing protein [Minwuiales bacterium]